MTDTTRCPSCGIAYTQHLGLIGVCRELQRLREALEKSADISDREMIYLDGTGWGINALRSAIIRADDCQCETLKRENAILREALEKIADLPTLSAPLSWGIAREALQRAGGGG